MKKIVLLTALSIASVFAFDVNGALKNVCTNVGTAALSGNTDTKSLTKVAGESAGITPDALGEKLATTVKSNNTTVTSMDKANELCTQASTIQSFANFDSQLVKQAIGVCSQNVMKK